MKSYTDLEQSKKLAEILPTESADMEYLLEQWIDEKTGRHQEEFYETPVVKVDDDCPLQPITLNCWSLAALLEVLPTIDDGNRNPVVCKDIRLNKWHIVYHGTAIEPTIDSGTCDNLIDACVEMIIKLHKEKLL